MWWVLFFKVTSVTLDKGLLQWKNNFDLLMASETTLGSLLVTMDLKSKLDVRWSVIKLARMVRRIVNAIYFLWEKEMQRMDSKMNPWKEKKVMKEKKYTGFNEGQSKMWKVN